jgi:hypothetical protein
MWMRPISLSKGLSDAGFTPLAHNSRAKSDITGELDRVQSNFGSIALSPIRPDLPALLIIS